MARLTLKSQGELVSFLSAGKAEIRSLKIHFSPKQAGSGDPSPENVRAIAGWTGVEATKCGKNLWNPDVFINNGYIDASGAVRSGSPFLHSDYLTFAPGTYHITGINNHNTVAANLRVHGYDDSKQWIRQIAAQSKAVNAKWEFSFAVLDSDKYVRISAPAPKESDSEFQLELGSTATAYKPYTGATYTLDWTSDLGTLYGGYVDLISGEVVEEWGIIAIYNGESLASEWLSDRDVYASGTTPTTGAQVAYELATPIAHQLTPTEIQTLIGQNNFWSSADSIEVEYDLIETRDTWMHRWHMFALSSPHTESLNGITLRFTTDMASNLKECKIHFTPIQEGTGDPSPDNVRPVRGWDGVTVGTRNNFIDASTYTWTSGKFLGRVSSGYSDSCDGTALSASSSYRMILDFLPCSHLRGNHIAIYPRLSSSAYAGIAFYTDENEESYIADSAFHAHGNVPNNARYMRVCALNAHDFLHFTISKTTSGSINAVVPYKGIYIPFPQTIYGGYVDLVKGEVVETHTSPTSWTATKGGAVNQYGFITYKADQSYVRSTSPSYQKCNTISKFGSISISTVAQRQCEIVSGSVYVALPEGENVNDIQVVYRVATPLIHTIDPVTIRTLRGMNNIFSDANGNIEIKYWTH